MSEKNQNQKIINLTQHKATPDQVSAGVIDFDEKTRQWLIGELTFEDLPNEVEVERRAIRITLVVLKRGYKKAMIGGAPYLMPVLQKYLNINKIDVCYAFSKRDIEEIQNPDGTVSKKTVFKHLGFVEFPA